MHIIAEREGSSSSESIRIAFFSRQLAEFPRAYQHGVRHLSHKTGNKCAETATQPPIQKHLLYQRHLALP